MQLFNRRWRLQVGTLELSDLDLAFLVERTSAREPSTAEIRVANLAPESRAIVEAGGVVILHAGYEDPPLLFRGDSRVAFTVLDGPDRWTTIQARDGGRAYTEARISRSYPIGTRYSQILRDAVTAAEIGEGNLNEFEASLSLRNRATVTATGYTASGPVRRVITDIVRAAGLRWSVQSGALQLQRQGQPLRSTAVLLSPDTGLIGTPTWDDQRRRRFLKAKTLIQPGLEPGRLVRVESALVRADFEVRGVVYEGETRGEPWYATLTLRPR